MRNWLPWLALVAATAGAVHADPPARHGRVLQVSSGFRHTCAIRDDHTLWCWGFNFDGELGTGNRTYTNAPVQVTALGDQVAQVSASDEHTCAVTRDGTLYCWGGGVAGDLGVGSNADSSVPLAVPGQTQVREVIAGPAVTCALEHDRSLQCWGNNSDGLLGVGGTGNQLTPAPVQGLDGVAIAAFSQLRTHCALDFSGNLYCWGPNQNGQLGLGDTVNRPLPTLVTTLGKPVVEVSARGQTTCALTIDDQLSCWGANPDGEVGNGTVDPAYPFAVTTPQPIALARVVGIHKGTSHSCAVQLGGRVACWGLNNAGQLGLGDTQTRTAPAPLAIDGVLTMSLGQSHSCALRVDGTVWCWGDNSLGQLGLGDNVGRTTPAQVTFPAP